MKKQLGESSIHITNENESHLSDFVKTYLPEDVVFMLRLMSLRNSHYDYEDLVVHRIVANLFYIYTAKLDSINQTQLTQLFDQNIILYEITNLNVSFFYNICEIILIVLK